MANMSYCRFRNTLGDLRDCAEALTECDGANLKEDERRAALNLIRTCAEIVERYWDEEKKEPNLEDYDPRAEEF